MSLALLAALSALVGAVPRRARGARFAVVVLVVQGCIAVSTRVSGACSMRPSMAKCPARLASGAKSTIVLHKLASAATRRGARSSGSCALHRRPIHGIAERRRDARRRNRIEWCNAIAEPHFGLDANATCAHTDANLRARSRNSSRYVRSATTTSEARS